jgi:hypothetical protein
MNTVFEDAGGPVNRTIQFGLNHKYSRINQIKIAEGTTKNPLMIGGAQPVTAM